MNFDKANTEVTRHSYGSRVDKEFKREGIIPLKDRKKNEIDYTAESAKYNELNKKVENRIFNDIKEQKSFDSALSKGYDELRESLLKDIMYELTIESMWVDRDDVDNNIRNVMNLVDEQVESIGGYKGFKDIAESSGNRLLLNMVKDCEEMCKIVGTRNIMEAAGNVSKLDFEMNKAEMDEFDYRKKSFGSETIINAVRDKVLDVVKYEQEANTAKQEVMDEIQMKVDEIDAPVGEAMEFIFNEKIEETTLFDSLMRKNYKNMLDTDCSRIFESKGVNEEDFEYEDDDFKMSDIELIDEEDEDTIKNMFLENAYSDIKNVLNESEEILEDELKSILETLNTMVQCKSKSEAIRLKDDIRNLQYAIEEGLFSKFKAKREAKRAEKEEKYNRERLKDLAIISEKELSKCEREFEKTVNDMRSLLKKEVSGCKFLNNRISKHTTNIGDYVWHNYSITLFDLGDGDHFGKFASKSKNPELRKGANDEAYNYVDELDEDVNVRIVKPILSKGFKQDKEEEEAGAKVFVKEKNGKNYLSIDLGDEVAFTMQIFMDFAVKKEMIQESADCETTANNVPAEAVKNNKKVKEEVIICPDCGKDPCKCKKVKESFEPIVEGVLKNKIVMAYDNYKHKKLNKVDFEKLRNSMIQIAANAKTIKDLDVLDRDVDFSISELEKMKRPENEEKITFHIEFLNKEYKKFLAEKRNEMNKQKCVESFVDKLDNYCDKLSHIIESHELARNSAVSSLTYELNNQTTFVPFIQPNDCNLSNLEFAYKTKLVCESLKSELKNVNNENDFMIIEKAVELNLQSINESLNIVKDMERMDYKKNVLKSCENYLNKIKHVIDNNVAPNNPITESTSVFGNSDDVEAIFNRVKEYTLIESTNNKLMETVMAESIVEYTILEVFNTLNLLKFDKESVRRMSRNNLK